MLDDDVAMLYHYETKNVNKAMKRNIERFPEDFCFQLTKQELNKMWFQIGTLNKKVNNEKVQENIYHMSILNREYQCLQGYKKMILLFKLVLV